MPLAWRSQRRSTRTPASITRPTLSRSISLRTSTKPEQFSSGAPRCSWTTTHGFVYCAPG